MSHSPKRRSGTQNLGSLSGSPQRVKRVTSPVDSFPPPTGLMSLMNCRSVLPILVCSMPSPEAAMLETR